MSYYIRAKNMKERRAIYEYVVCDLEWTAYRMCALPAWLDLPVYKTYLNVGIDEENRNIHTTATDDDMPKGAQFMTLDEFKAKHPIVPFVKTPPVFYMGFEIEGCVQRDVRADLIAYVRSLYPRVAEHNLIHHDGSVHASACRAADHQSIEIVTPPLPESDAIERLEWLLGTLDILSDEGLFETNRSCGFHVNVSEKGVFTEANRKVRDSLALRFMTRLRPKKWKKAFNRHTGAPDRYCRWKDAPRTIAQVAKHADHYSAINTSHLHSEHKTRRLEVRVAGGRDYHRKHDKMRDFLLDISTAMQEAHDAV